MNNHILFIHIPKTSGTSFRIAAEEYFGKQNTFYDYSFHSIETSNEIMDAVYNAKDPYRFYSMVSKSEHSFFSGHFSTVKYSALYETLNVVSFVRDPVEQVLSHYNHYKNHNAYEKSLTVFAKEARFKNIQSKHLRQKNLALYGFLGVTEQYNTSIDLFNFSYNTHLSQMYINKKKKGSLVTEDLDQKVLDLIRRMNAKDIALYGAVCQQFEVRKNLYANNQPFTYGFIQKKDENRISGCAFQRESDEAVEIDIYMDDKYLETILAKNFRPGQVRQNVPRKGFIGFDYLYKGDGVLDGEIYAFVKATGQEII